MSRATYYMVEMNYPHKTLAEREAFDRFYRRHIDMLLTIPGFMSAQRFHCVESGRAPFLALYRLVGPDVMTSEAYRSKAGRMSVDPEFRINMVNWDRNLVQGPEGTSDPDLSIKPEETFMLVDRLTDDAPPLPPIFTPLEIVGLDRTIVQRGVSFEKLDYKKIPTGWEVRVWRPIHPVRKPV
ncbi:MAG: hypothetical protein VYA17_16380 [Pseudomonadota bacterium]|nr:hypothetical protein [Pseudomonadota bacterium]